MFGVQRWPLRDFDFWLNKSIFDEFGDYLKSLSAIANRPAQMGRRTAATQKLTEQNPACPQDNSFCGEKKGCEKEIFIVVNAAFTVTYSVGQIFSEIFCCYEL